MRIVIAIVRMDCTLGVLLGDTPSSPAGGNCIHVVSGVSSDWVIGWKGAYASVASDLRTLKFKPLVVNLGVYGVDDKAACFGSRPKHIVPADYCHCGFNAWSSKEHALQYVALRQILEEKNMRRIGRIPPSYGWFRSVVLLRVGIYGDVIEGTLDAGKNWNKWGYRASHQRVADVYLDDRCAACDAKAHYICAMSKAYTRSHELLPLRSYCSEHAQYGGYILQISRLAEYNNISIHWGEPSE